MLGGWVQSGFSDCHVCFLNTSVDFLSDCFRCFCSGVVENLNFADNGSGLVSITGFAGGGLTGIQVIDTVNLSNGRIELSLSGHG